MATRTTARKPAAKPAQAKKEVTYGEKEDGSLSGNLTRDFELRFTPSGRAVANSAVAVNERVKNEKTGEWEDTEAEFFNVTVWGDQAEHACEAFRKGDRVVAVGFFQDRTYENREGTDTTVTEFTAKDIGPSLLWVDVEIKRVRRGK